MTRLFRLGFLLMGLASAAPAQHLTDSLRLRYDRETIFLHNTRAYFKNYRTYPIGFSGLGMRREFEASPQGLVEFEKFRRNRSTGRILSLLGAATVFVVPQVLLNPGTTRASANTAFYVLLGGLGISFGGNVLVQKSYNQLQHAVWLRNRDVLIYDGPPPVR
jgi:hypothetical protein